MKHQILATFVLTEALMSGIAAAPAPTIIRERGTIESQNGNTLEISIRGGSHVVVRLSDNARVAGAKQAQVSDMKPDSYVGTAAVPSSNGTLRALEVHVFDPSMRGSGEGTRPWDLSPASSMTNGAVGSLVSANGQ
ncbi:MAG TPA: hypothetical protein VGI23_19100, partial [Steroidobacteraceae bacterium]